MGRSEIHPSPEHAGKPLAGRTVLVTRAGAQAHGLATRIEAAGGHVVELPVIEIRPPKDFAAFDAAMRQIEKYDWVIFTSVNSVAPFLERLAIAGKTPAVLAAARVAAIGPETAKRLEAAGIRGALLPERYQAEGILESVPPASMRAKRVLIPRAAEAREVLPQTLRGWGAIVDVVVAYRTDLPDVDIAHVEDLLRRGAIDVITFTSSSTVRNFVALFGGRNLAEIAGRAVVACIGPITARTAAEAGSTSHIIAEEFTTAGLTRAMAEHFRKAPQSGRGAG